MNRTPFSEAQGTADHAARRFALASAIGLLLMAILAPFAQFGVLGQLVVAADPAATTRNLAASAGLFGAGIGAFLIVAILDVLVAWTMYRLLRPVDPALARFVGWSRVAYAVIFAYAILNLVQAAQLVGGASPTDVASAAFQSQVASLTASFGDRWDVGLVLFGLHLFGLGSLLLRSQDFPRAVSALVVVAGAGYLVDALGRLFVPGYALTVSMVTFIGEALLILWLFKIAVGGSRAASAGPQAASAPAQPSAAEAS